MKNFQKIKSFILGVIVTVILCNLVVNVNAALASKKIDVLTGVTVYVDGVKFEPVDSNGNPIEIFTYNGVTYLPSENLAATLGKSVYWDGDTLSLYLGNSDVVFQQQNTSALSLTNDNIILAQSAVDNLKETLINYHSLILNEIRMYRTDSGNDCVEIDYHATNSYGGFIHSWYIYSKSTGGLPAESSVIDRRNFEYITIPIYKIKK